MKKAKLLGTLLCAACLVTGSIAPSVPVMADGMNVVTLGADLTQDQKNTMLKYFKVSADSVQIINVTNQDEREHLSAYVPIEQMVPGQSAVLTLSLPLPEESRYVLLI